MNNNTLMGQLYSIIGIDGSGKDWLLQACLSQAAGRLRPLPATHFHHSPDCHYPALSLLLQKISNLADEAGNADLKSISLFFKMLLFGLEYNALAADGVTILSTRHPAIDTVAYGRLFVRRMPLSPADSAGQLEKIRPSLLAAEWTLLQEFLALPAVAPYAPQLQPLVFRLSERPLSEQLQAYSQLFGVPLPDKIVYLRTPPEQALENLGRRADAQPEIHEQHHYLKIVQQHFDECLQALADLQPESRLLQAEAGGPQELAAIFHFLTP